MFSASSSGLQYALAEYWRSEGWLPAVPSLPQDQAVPCIAVVSGSCSPMSAAQIEWAEQNGFIAERLDLQKCLDPVQADAEIERLVRLAADAMSRQVSPVIY